jgi:hypothetical protein
MPILDIQKRARELGRIRIGQVVPTANGKTRPEKLDRFRLTSASRPLLEKVAELYGGEVVQWQPQGGGASAWEVVTDSRRLPIMVPPQPVTQWYEFWTAGGCKHRCDGRTNVLTDELCDPDDHGHKEALKRPTTRLNVVLRDVEGIGVWRLESHGWNAAVELPDSADFLAAAGGYVNGWVSLEARTSKAEVPDRNNGGTKIETRHFMVPIIEIDVTPAQLMAGRGRVAAPALAGGPVVETPALAAAGPDYVALAAELTTADEIRDLWHKANQAGHMTQGLSDHLQQRATALKEAGTPPAQEVADDEVAVGEVVEDSPATAGAPAAELDPDVVWQQIIKVAGEGGMTLPDVQDHFSARMGGLSSADASAAELQAYLNILVDGVPA